MKKKDGPLAFFHSKTFHIISQGITSNSFLLFKLFFVLISLSLFQTFLIFVLGPLIRVIFEMKNLGVNGEIPFNSLFPTALQNSLSFSSHLRISTSGLIVLFPVLLIVIGFFKSLFQFFFQLISDTIILFAVERLRISLFKNILEKNYLELEKKSPAQWMSLLMNDLNFLQSRLSDVFQGLIRDGALVICAFGTLIYLSPKTALIFFLSASVVGYFMGQMGKKISIFALKFQQELSLMADHILSLRKRFEYMSSQQGQNYEKNSFQKKCERYLLLIQNSLLYRAIFAPGLEFLGFTVVAVVLLNLDLSNFNAESFSSFFSFFAAVGILVKPFKNIGEQYSRLAEFSGVIKPFEDLLVIPTPSVITTKVEIQAPPSSYVFNTIACGYQPGDPKFTAQNITLKPGKIYAIIGESGTGKSTFLKTLAGLLTPLEWQASLSYKSFTDQGPGYVSQKPFLFTGTLYDNLSYHKDQVSLDKANPTEKEMWQHLEMFGLKEIFASQSLGLNTHISALTTLISGGQKQRITLARSIIRKPNIILWDEATSSLDETLEEKALTTLKSYLKEQNGIGLVITHRVSFLNLFDEILFIKKGRLTHTGSHEDLLQFEDYSYHCRQEGA